MFRGYVAESQELRIPLRLREFRILQLIPLVRLHDLQIFNAKLKRLQNLLPMRQRRDRLLARHSNLFIPLPFLLISKIAIQILRQRPLVHFLQFPLPLFFKKDKIVADLPESQALVVARAHHQLTGSTNHHSPHFAMMTL